MYGAEWDSGEVPLRTLLAVPDAEIQRMQIEARNLVTESKARAERDMWSVWNEIREDVANPVINNTSLTGSWMSGGGGGGDDGDAVDVVKGRSTRHKVKVETPDDRFVSAELGMRPHSRG